MLLFDHGERRSGVPAELERLGVHVRGARLPAGERHRAGARTEAGPALPGNHADGSDRHVGSLAA